MVLRDACHVVHFISPTLATLEQSINASKGMLPLQTLMENYVLGNSAGFFCFLYKLCKVFIDSATDSAVDSAVGSANLR